MAGRAPGDSAAVDLTHPLGRVARQLAWAAEGGIGVAGRMHRLSPHVVVESVEVNLVLVAVTVTVTASGSGSGIAMEVGLGMGIGVRRFLGETRRLREHRGVTGIGHRETDGHCRGLGLVRVRQRRGGGGS